ncbi:MAG: DUF3459 domain-containing protein [Actinobacteria bacterium]|nr:DUF3459 domain-containing protein [Actinomycetota bacterium]
MTEPLVARATPLLELLYPGRGPEVAEQLATLVATYAPAISEQGPRTAPDHRTVLLITYADAVDPRDGGTPLATLHRTLTQHVGDLVTDVHLLPMFPSTSDDGFAVSDHSRLDPQLGSWADVAGLSTGYRLMFDFVANHVSASHPWVHAALAGEPGAAAHFTTFDPGFDTNRVIRPRTSPLFHDYPRSDGSPLTLWTTFSADQVDLNFADPATLLDLTEVLLSYLARGASSIRLDAIGFIWKTSGTTCMHLPETHAVVKLWRLVVDQVRPGVQIVTETNVPQAENLSYFGAGTDEAHQVYQFALPPLVLHTFVSGSVRALTDWADQIAPVSASATYLNFLASHDGIGMRPAQGLLSARDQEALVLRVVENGGLVSMKSNRDGTQDVYELNISYLDALASPSELGRPELVACKALAAHAILLSLIGIPAIYYHSLFGSAGDPEAAHHSGIARRINRAHLDEDRLAEEVSTDPRRRSVLTGLKQLLDARRGQPAFSPYSPQHVERLDDRVFALRRGEGASEVRCLVNVTDQVVDLPDVSGYDVVGGARHDGVRLPPYGYVWLTTGA